jgi:hypothetical protein
MIFNREMIALIVSQYFKSKQILLFCQLAKPRSFSAHENTINCSRILGVILNLICIALPRTDKILRCCSANRLLRNAFQRLPIMLKIGRYFYGSVALNSNIN